MKYEKRPWGDFYTIFQTRRFWVKVIRVGVGQRTSVQTHDLRDEVHIYIKDWELLFKYVPRGKPHSLYHGKYLEFAWGLCSENDIHRIDDFYGRHK